MLISVTEAGRRYNVAGPQLTRALKDGDLTRHEADTGAIRLDTDELDQLYAQTTPRDRKPSRLPAAEPPQEPRRDPRGLPSPDELDSSVARAIGR